MRPNLFPARSRRLSQDMAALLRAEQGRQPTSFRGHAGLGTDLHSSDRAMLPVPVFRLLRALHGFSYPAR